MFARSCGLLALLAVCLLSLPTPAFAAPAAPPAGASANTSVCFGSMLYDAFTNRSRVIQISIVFVAAGYFFLKGNIRR
jgi:hypothetical protein